MSEHVQTGGPEPSRRRAGTTGARREAWHFNMDDANKAYKDCAAIATKTVETFQSFDKAARDLCRGLYGLITVVLPEDALATMRKEWGEEGVTDEQQMASTRDFNAFLKAHNLPRPPLRSNNPFLGWFQTFWTDVAQAKHGMKKAEAKEILTDAVDIKKLRTEKAAENTMVSRYAKLVLVAVDMNQDQMLNKSFREAFTEYENWQKHHPTLQGKPAVQRGRKSATEGASSTGTSSTKPDSGSEAEDFEAGTDYDPFDESVMAAAADKTGDTAAEKKLDEDLKARTSGAAPATPADKPTEDKPAEDKPTGDKPTADKPVDDKPAETTAVIQPAEGGGISLVLPDTSLRDIGMTPPAERDKSPALELDIEGKVRVVRHRVLLTEPVRLKNRSLVSTAPVEGLLRYRREGDEIVILETMDWEEDAAAA